MKYASFLLSISLLIGGCKASKVSPTDISTTIFLVRHAEKVKDGTKDPKLSEQGKARAKAMANHLKHKNIRAIYASDYQRTRQTAQPLADELDLDIIIYNPHKLENLKKKILKEYIYGEAILVVGHSNSTPDLANLIVGKKQFKPIEEKDYDNFYKIEVSYDGGKKASKTKQLFF